MKDKQKKKKLKKQNRTRKVRKKESETISTRERKEVSKRLLVFEWLVEEKVAEVKKKPTKAKIRLYRRIVRLLNQTHDLLQIGVSMTKISPLLRRIINLARDFFGC